VRTAAAEGLPERVDHKIDHLVEALGTPSP
jgi:hypothetical protein